MFRIEKTLLLAKDINDITFKAVIKEFLKEANMLISNIHLTHIYLQKEVGNAFPLESNKYDGSWYKNLFVAAEIIIDRMYSRIEENKDYLKPFNDVYECDFVAFAKKWNKINFMVKYNTTDEEWDQICKQYNVFTTSRKLEEIIAKNIGINIELLRSLSLNLNEYRSIAKKLDDDKRNDYDSLIANLVPNMMDETAQAMANAANQNQQNQPGMQGPNSTIVQAQPVAPISQKPAKGPLSPLKKEMDQILKWIVLREDEIKTYKNKQLKGYDEKEYKLILDKLAAVQAELKEVDYELTHTKVKAPLDPLAKELAQIERWSKEQESAIKRYIKAKNNDNANEELKQIEKCLAKLEKELDDVNNELNNTKVKAPLDPFAKELSKILSWVKSREADVRAYKKLQRQESINDELKLIEKELAIVHDKSKDISETINFIHQNRPVDPYKKDLDQLIRWIATKEKDIRKLKAETLKKERAMKAVLIEQLRKEIEAVDLEIKNSKALIGIYDEEVKQEPEKQEMNPIEQEALEREKQNMISKREMLNRLRKEMKEIDDEINLNKKIVKRQLLLDSKLNKSTEKDLDVINNLSEQQLYDLAEIYDIEAAILRTAIEVMPANLRKYGIDALPKMLQHLLESGYIEVKDDYILVNPENQFKLKQAVKVSK